jgi:hypothetical protein
MIGSKRAVRHWPRAVLTFSVVLLLTAGVFLSVMAAEVSIQAILAAPDKFDQQTVTVRGRAMNIYLGETARGTYATFALTDAKGAKLRVFTLGHPEIPSGDGIEVTGVLQKVRRREQKTFHNELQATTIKKVAP